LGAVGFLPLASGGPRRHTDLHRLYLGDVAGLRHLGVVLRLGETVGRCLRLALLLRLAGASLGLALRARLGHL